MLNNHVSRRGFLQLASTAALAPGVSLPAEGSAAAAGHVPGPFRGTLCFFSKPVPQLNWKELAQSAKNAGFDGIDLTVRPRGHVVPERVATDLPRAAAAIRDAGLKLPMITTALLTADDPSAAPILETASKLSIPYVKPGYYTYKLINVLKELDEAGEKFRGLVKLAEEHGLQVGYHNHPDHIGAAIWDMARVIEPLDPRSCGFYYDLSQATMDGQASCWKVSAHLVMPRLKMVAAKDFIWKKIGPHKWHHETCALGKGMSQWRDFLEILAQTDFHGPISYQQEYAIPGVADRNGIAISRAKVSEVMAAVKENLDYLKSMLHEAYEGSQQ